MSAPDTSRQEPLVSNMHLAAILRTPAVPNPLTKDGLIGALALDLRDARQRAERAEAAARALREALTIEHKAPYPLPLGARCPVCELVRGTDWLNAAPAAGEETRESPDTISRRLDGIAEQAKERL